MNTKNIETLSQLAFLFGWYLSSAREWAKQIPSHAKKIYNKIACRKLRATFVKRVNYVPTGKSPIHVYQEKIDPDARVEHALRSEDSARRMTALVREVKEIRKNCKEC
jgi:hypothetical protein